MTATMIYERDCIRWNTESGQTSRANGPCYISAEGTVYFSQLNPRYFTRTLGPSSVTANGMVMYRNEAGKPYRTDGPAIIYSSGRQEYWIDGNPLTFEEYFLKFGKL